MGYAEAVTYSGPTYVAIRSGKDSSSVASSHTVHLATLSNFREGGLKPLVLISSEGGPDDNLRYTKVISHAIDLVKHDLMIFSKDFDLRKINVLKSGTVANQEIRFF